MAVGMEQHLFIDLLMCWTLNLLLGSHCLWLWSLYSLYKAQYHYPRLTDGKPGRQNREWPAWVQHQNQAAERGICLFGEGYGYHAHDASSFLFWMDPAHSPASFPFSKNDEASFYLFHSPASPLLLFDLCVRKQTWSWRMLAVQCIQYLQGC